MPVLRRKLDPGTVHIDTDSAPRVIQFGEDFWEEDLPVGTRVIYPKPPVPALPNAALSTFGVVEKVAPGGRWLSRSSGVLLLVWGAALPFGG